MSEVEAFTHDVGELLSQRIKRFSAFVVREWKLTPDKKTMAELDLTADQIDGWNRCCDSIEGAADVWLDEWHQ